MSTLRPYQSAAIDALRGAIRAGSRSVVLVSPTGSGKTQIAAEIIRSATERGNRTLFLAHRRELVQQAAGRLWRDHQLAAGVIMAGVRPAPTLPVQVASIQTLARRAPPEAQIVIIDECHHAAARSHRALLEQYPSATILGLTATPFRLDGQGLGDLFQDLVVAATPAELLAQGFLCEATAFAYVPPDLAGVRTVAGDYDGAALGTAYEQSGVLGDVVTRWQEHAAGKRTILFASTIANSLELVERFKNIGVRAEHLDYHVPTAARAEIIARVRSGETTVIANVGILGEGIDVPELEVAVLARPTKSLAVYLQQVGRVLRPAPGKPRAVILDHAGCIVRHGLWTQDRDYSLTATVEKQPRATSVKTCPFCFCCCAGGARTCPACGHQFAAETIPHDLDGEHVELSMADLIRVLAEKKDRDRLLEIFAAEARERGWRPGSVIRRVHDQIAHDGARCQAVERCELGFSFPAAWWRQNVSGSRGAFRWRPRATPAVHATLEVT